VQGGTDIADPQSALTVLNPVRTHVTLLKSDAAEGMLSLAADEAVPVHARLSTLDGLSVAQNYFATTFGVGVQRPVRIDLRAYHPDDVDFGGFTANHHIVIYASSQRGVPVSDYYLRRAAIHELFHVLQQELSGGADLAIGPNWLVEGGARLVEDIASVQSVPIQSAPYQDTYFGCALLNEEAQARRPLPPLSAMHYYGPVEEGGNAGYALAALGAKRAIGAHGPAALGVYYRELAHGDWQAAFVRAFGVEPEAFYKDFARARANDWPIALADCNTERDDDED